MAQAADAADGGWRSGQSVAAADGADSSEPQIGADTSEPQIGADASEPQIGEDTSEPQIGADASEPQIGADGPGGIGLRSSQYLGAADLRGVCRPSSFAGSLDA